MRQRTATAESTMWLVAHGKEVGRRKGGQEVIRKEPISPLGGWVGGEGSNLEVVI